MENENDGIRCRAILEFVGYFGSLSGPPPTELVDLNDGVALFEMLSEM
jgi:hypothetical protein